MIPNEFAFTILGVVGGGGVAWGVLRTRVATLVQRQDAQDKRIDDHATKDEAHHIDTTNRLARMEGKFDGLANEVRRAVSGR